MAIDTDNISASDGFVAGKDGFLDDINLDPLYNVPMEISVVLGEVKMPVRDLLQLKDGDVVELDRMIGEDVDVFINNRLVAKGEVVVVEENIAITMTEIIKDQ